MEIWQVEAWLDEIGAWKKASLEARPGQVWSSLARSANFEGAAHEDSDWFTAARGQARDPGRTAGRSRRVGHPFWPARDRNHALRDGRRDRSRVLFDRRTACADSARRSAGRQAGGCDAREHAA